MRHTRGAGSEVDADGLIRRQKMTTWGILAFAVFVSVGMAEWSKRSAMGEKVVSPQVMERALAIAEKMEDRRSSQPQHAGGWTTASRSEMGISDAGKNLSDLGVSAVKSLATAEAQRRGGVFHSSGNDAATIQTRAGEQK